MTSGRILNLAKFLAKLYSNTEWQDFHPNSRTMFRAICAAVEEELDALRATTADETDADREFAPTTRPAPFIPQETP
jgi:RNA polymerase-interacting CarD/CdnL/TRCF family regulator